MNKFLTITFSTGHIYEVPAAAVAEDRTAYYAVQDPDRTREQHAAETEAMFASEFELFDWAKNNMNWSDLQKRARLVGFNAPDFGGLWDDAVLSTSEDQAMPDVISLGEDALTAPIEMVLSQTVAEGAHCTLLAFQQPDTKAVTSAVVAIVGAPDVVEGYIATIANFDAFMSANKAGQPAGH